MSFMEKLTFRDLTQMLEVSVKANIEKKEKYLKKYFERTNELARKYRIECPKHNCSLYPLLRILLSNEENERSYGLQEKSLKKILIKSFKVNEIDAKIIEQCNENELADTTYEIVKSRSSRESKITIQQLDDILNQLCENQKQQFQQAQFEFLYLNCSALDLKWIVKIILKGMRTKINSLKVLENYHPLANTLYKKFNQLSKICEIIENGTAEEYAKDAFKPFIPIRPMLSQKFSVGMNNILVNSEFYQEIKLDGERFQCHMENGVFKYYSRNAYEYSENFNILISPLIKFKAVTHSVILDGEMVIWNKIKKRFVTKGETELDVKKLKDPDYHLRPCYCAFDVLYLNGTSFLNHPYSERCDILSSLFDDQTGVLIKTKPIKIRDIEHLVTLFNEAMSNEEEGIILKKSNSIYMPGEREKGGWYKVKADYFDGELVKDFDCVIVGGRFQNIYKKDYLQTYQVGTVEKVKDNVYKVYVIGEVTHGLSISNRIKLNERLRPHFRDFPAESEINFEKGCVYFGKEKPDVYIPPTNSIVLQIRVSELAPSKDFCTNFTFRFPRITEIRYDKFWDDSTTLDEFKDAHNCENTGERRVKKVNQRSMNKDDIEASHPSKRRKLVSSRSIAIASLSKDSQDDIESIDNVLEGKEFCVLTTSDNLPSIRDLKALIRTHGGTITEIPREHNTFAIIAGDIRRFVQNYINKSLYNVIKADWIVENLSMKKKLQDFPELKPSDFHFLNQTMKEQLSSKYDEYGDSYFDSIKSIEEFKNIINSMDTNGATLNLEDFKEFENEIYNDEFQNPYFFSGLSTDFYDVYETINYFMAIAKNIFKYRAGTISNLSEYLFVDERDFNKTHQNKIADKKIIDIRFILDSNDAGRLLNINEYII